MPKIKIVIKKELKKGLLGLWKPNYKENREINLDD